MERACFLLIVDMMCGVKMLVERFYVMQFSLHLVYIELDYKKINDQIDNIGHQTNITLPPKTVHPYDHLLEMSNASNNKLPHKTTIAVAG